MKQSDRRADPQICHKAPGLKAWPTYVFLLALAAGPTLVAQTMTFGGPAQSRDNSNLPTTGTAVVSGRVVTEDATPQPVRRARVLVQRVDSDFSRWTMTDASGQFAIKDLPMGRYTVTASKGGYVRATFGAKKFDRPGTQLSLAEGQHADASMTMLRGAVITGTVRDENGMPAPNVAIRLMQYRMLNGERTLVGAVSGNGALGESSDDRGAYRLFGLAPGEYVISATPRDSGRSTSLKQMTDSTLRAAQSGLKPNNTPTTGPTQQQPVAQAPGDEPTVGFAPLYYPGALFPTEGTTVTVGAGEERNSVDVQLRIVPTSRIAGKVIVPDGVPPQSVQLSMAPASTGGVNVTGFVMINSANVAADGSFAFTGVVPGAYTINARAASPQPGQGANAQSVGGFNIGAGGGGRGAGQTVDQMVQGMRGGGDGSFRIIGGGGPLNLWANADVTVNGQNLSGLVLPLQEGMKFSGQLAFEGTRPAPKDDFPRARIQLLPGPGAANGGAVVFLAGGGASQVDANGHFTLTGVTPGKYRVFASLSSPEANWTLKSAIAKGRDLLDFPLEIAPNEDVANAVLTFTDLTQSITGSLQDPSGRPAPDYTIVVFPADKELWTSTRRIRTARPGTDGKFTFNNMPSGDYRIAALTDLGPNDTQDPSFFNELVSASYAFTLKDGETHVQDLKIR